MIRKYYCGGPNGEMSTDGLIDAVQEWGRSHKIDNPDKQMLHCYEECAEAARYIIREDWNIEKIKSELGDIVVTVIVLADILGLDIVECLEVAHKKNEKRTGRVIKGNFVKSEDLNEED